MCRRRSRRRWRGCPCSSNPSMVSDASGGHARLFQRPAIQHLGRLSVPDVTPCICPVRFASMELPTETVVRTAETERRKCANFVSLANAAPPATLTVCVCTCACACARARVCVHAHSCQASVICLEEVQPNHYQEIEAELRSVGYKGFYSPKIDADGKRPSLKSLVSASTKTIGNAIFYQ